MVLRAKLRRRRWQSALLGGAAALLVGGLVGCGGDATTATPTSTTAAAPTFERIQKQVFDVSCTSSSCHSSLGQAGNLVLEEGKSYDNLVNDTPSNPVAGIDGMMRVMPGRPDMSLLYAKVTTNLQSGMGVSMPYSAAPLPPETTDIIIQG
jgi:hypothetical protein